LFDELEELEEPEAAAAAAATAAAAAAAEAAAAGVTLEVGLSKGDRGGWLTAGDEGVFGWGVPSFSEEVRRSWGEPPGGSPEAVASYLLAQLFMGLWLFRRLCVVDVCCPDWAIVDPAKLFGELAEGTPPEAEAVDMPAAEPE
jgi:hypothetical protein